MKYALFSLILFRVYTSIVLVVFLVFSLSSPSFALTPTQQKIFRYQIYTYDDEVNTACGTIGDGGSTNVSSTQSQKDIAKIVIGIAKTNNLGKEGAFIGLIVGMAESKLTIYANSKVPLSLQFPHQAVGSDHYSLGVMQQQITTDWSTISSDISNKDAVAQLMDPAYNAEAFFGSPPGSNAPRQLSKGLQNVSNWQKLDPWVAAQRVQASGTPDGSNYKAFVNAGRALLNELYDSSPAIPLPVPISGGSSTAGSISNSSCSSSINCDTASVDTSVSDIRRQVVCRTQAEYKLWQSGSLKPGTGYKKYSLGRSENWCADFASWIFNQAGYPIDPSAKQGNVPAVSTIEDIGQKNVLFHYHAAAGYTPKPGDLAIHYQNGSPSHVNIVTAVEGTNITLIGGNQSTYNFNTSNVSQYNISSSTGDGVKSYVSPD